MAIVLLKLSSFSGHCFTARVPSHTLFADHFRQSPAICVQLKGVTKHPSELRESCGPAICSVRQPSCEFLLAQMSLISYPFDLFV